MCEETKCYVRFKTIGDGSKTSANCIGCQRAYQRGYQSASRKAGNDKSVEKPRVAKPRKKGRHSSAEYNAKWRMDHHEEWNAWRRQYRKLHPEKSAVCAANDRARKAGVEGTLEAEEWISLKSRYNNACLCCGRTDAILCLDHIIPLEKGGPNCIDNIQPLCMPCNSRKHTKIIDFRPQNT